MIGTERKMPAPDDLDADEQEAAEAAAEVIDPAMPPAGGAIMGEIDPRLNRPSETEAELRELVDNNESAAEEEAEEQAGTVGAKKD